MLLACFITSLRGYDDAQKSNGGHEVKIRMDEMDKSLYWTLLQKRV